MAKPKVATASLAGCFGCHMSFLDIDERLIDLIELVDFDKSPIDDIKEFDGPVELGLIEGGVSSEHNLEVLKSFREHCGILVAVGECALTGGIPRMRNLVPLEECLREAFLDGPTVENGVIPSHPDLPRLLDRVYPIHEVVKVDYLLPGCPPPADAFWEALVAILTDRPIDMPYGLVKFD